MGESFEVKISERVSKAETKIDSLEKKIDDMDDMKTAITTLVTIQQEREKRDIIQDEENKKQSEALIDLKGTLIRINDNLDALNNEAKETKEEVKETNKRIDKLEDKYSKSEEKSKIDIRDILKSFFLKILFPTGFFISVVYYILKSMNKV